MVALSLQVNDFLSGLFIGVGLRLVDFKLEFGRFYTEDTLQIVLADEIGLIIVGFGIQETNEKLDKDRFHQKPRWCP